MSGHLKIKKILNLVLSKPENHILRCKTAKHNEFEFSRKKKQSFIAEIKLQVDQIKSQMEANFNEPLFSYKSNIFIIQRDHKVSSN